MHVILPKAWRTRNARWYYPWDVSLKRDEERKEQWAKTCLRVIERWSVSHSLSHLKHKCWIIHERWQGISAAASICALFPAEKLWVTEGKNSPMRLLHAVTNMTSFSVESFDGRDFINAQRPRWEAQQCNTCGRWPRFYISARTCVHGTKVSQQRFNGAFSSDRRWCEGDNVSAELSRKEERSA